MSTFLAYTSPAAGHLFPLVPGLLELQRRGHDVHVVTAPDLVDVVRAAGLKADGVDERILDVHVADHELPDDRHRLRTGLAQLMDRGPFERHDIDDHMAELSPDAVLVDTNAFGATVGAAASGRPWALTLPSLLPLPGPGIPPYGLGLRPRRDLVGRVRDRIVWPLVVREYTKALVPPLNRLRLEAGLAPVRTAFDHVLGGDLLIALAGPPLEYARSTLPPTVRMVGAAPWDPPAPPPGWLTEPGDPWVLVTCSTDHQADELLARTALEALADEPVRVLVTLADADDAFDAPPPPNARVERFVPHAAVLEHCTAVVCPSGMGISAKALGQRVPIVAVPFGRDQPEIARRITEAGAGVTVRRKDLDAATLRDAVRRARALRPHLPAVEPPARAAARFADAATELLGRPD